MSTPRDEVQVRSESVPPTPWRNGGGRTRELLTRPRQGEWRLRISLADIDQDGPFSAFPGTQRWFGVVAGSGVSLRFGQDMHRLTADSPALRFDGAAAPDCHLLDGPTRDLNLMLRSGTAHMSQVQGLAAWDAPIRERGLFAIREGTLHCAGRDALLLPALTLVWFVGAGPCWFEPRRLEPRSAANAGCASNTGWWLGWSPEQAQSS